MATELVGIMQYLCQLKDCLQHLLPLSMIAVCKNLIKFYLCRFGVLIVLLDVAGIS